MNPTPELTPTQRVNTAAMSARGWQHIKESVVPFELAHTLAAELEQAHKDIAELNTRLSERTQAFLGKDVRQMERIAELEFANECENIEYGKLRAELAAVYDKLAASESRAAAMLKSISKLLNTRDHDGIFQLESAHQDEWEELQKLASESIATANRALEGGQP